MVPDPVFVRSMLVNVPPKIPGVLAGILDLAVWDDILKPTREQDDAHESTGEVRNRERWAEDDPDDDPDLDDEVGSCELVGASEQFTSISSQITARIDRCCVSPSGATRCSGWGALGSLRPSRNDRRSR